MAFCICRRELIWLRLRANWFSIRFALWCISNVLLFVLCTLYRRDRPCEMTEGLAVTGYASSTDPRIQACTNSCTEIRYVIIALSNFSCLYRVATEWWNFTLGFITIWVFVGIARACVRFLFYVAFRMKWLRLWYRYIMYSQSVSTGIRGKQLPSDRNPRFNLLLPHILQLLLLCVILSRLVHPLFSY